MEGKPYVFLDNFPRASSRTHADIHFPLLLEGGGKATNTL